jgi:uncharacterized Zn finger protein
VKFEDLSWDDLEQWAGAKVAGRARSYVRKVKGLVRMKDGSLLAWVDGSDRYATRVEIDKQDGAVSECSCPFEGSPCKHAVAVVLAYQRSAPSNEVLPLASLDDERLERLGKIIDEVGKEKTAVATEEAGRKREDRQLQRHLEGLSKRELLKLVKEGLGLAPELKETLADGLAVRKGDVGRLVAAARREIEAAAAEEAWMNYWDRRGNTPDYSKAKRKLEQLLALGQVEAVIELGELLVELGMEQLGHSHDEGETGMEIASCMEVVGQAVWRSKWPNPKRLLWQIDLALQDEYSIFDSLRGPLEVEPCRPEDWSQVADELGARLAKLPACSANPEVGDSARYRRAELMNWLLRALEKAGRGNECIAVLEREVERVHCYAELVKAHRNAGRSDRAREWAIKGFDRTLKSLPGLAWELEELLRELAAKEKDYPRVTAYRALEFFKEPGLARYAELRNAAAKVGTWDPIRKIALEFLQTGRRPDKDPGWPLPPTEVKWPAGEKGWQRFPDLTSLVAIALDEKRHDDAIRLHRESAERDRYNGGACARELADAVAKTHPEAAIRIWRELAAGQIAYVKPSAYEEAGRYLRKIRDVCRATGRLDDWRTLLAGLRLENRRRPRLLEVLETMD